MEIRIEKPVTIITPTIGSPKIRDAIRSVASQTYRNIRHLVVVDGPAYENAYKLLDITESKVQVVVSPDNTGRDGFYGHRIYAAYPHLINSDYIAFLDEDNWYEPNHIDSLVKTIENRSVDFAYSFRKIFDQHKNFVAEDNCESLGKWPIWPSLGHKLSAGQFPYLIDTSSFLFRRKFIQSTCHLWHSGWGGDRRFFMAVDKNSEFDTNRQHTLCYRLDGNAGSVSKEFFEQGNKQTLQYYGGKLPWKEST